MSKPEEILKKLNQQSADLQPNVVSLLEEIQQRFFTSDGKLKADGQPGSIESNSMDSADNLSTANTTNSTANGPSPDDLWPSYGAPTLSDSAGSDSAGDIAGQVNAGQNNPVQSGPSQNPGGSHPQPTPSIDRVPVRGPKFFAGGNGGDGSKRQTVSASISSQTAQANQELSEIFQSEPSSLDSTMVNSPSQEFFADSASGGAATIEPLAAQQVSAPYSGEQYSSGQYSVDQISTEQYSPVDNSIPMAIPVEDSEQQSSAASEPQQAKAPVANPHFVKTPSRVTSPSPVATPATPETSQTDPQIESKESSIQFEEVENLERPLAVYSSVWLQGLTPDREIGLVTTEIMKKAPAVSSHTIQLVSPQNSLAPTCEVATRIAWELSIRQEAPVLLVDADFEKREISRQLDNVYLPGLAETLNLGQDWKPFVGATGIEGLYWLPCGKGDMTFRKATAARWSVISEQLKEEFSYVCIYSGESDNIVAQSWGRFCDFTFLIASMQDELGEETKRAVDDLRMNDCRLAGLVTVG